MNHLICQLLSQWIKPRVKVFQNFCRLFQTRHVINSKARESWRWLLIVSNRLPSFWSAQMEQDSPEKDPHKTISHTITQQHNLEEKLRRENKGKLLKTRKNLTVILKGSIIGFLVSFVKNDEIRPSISCQIILE